VIVYAPGSRWVTAAPVESLSEITKLLPEVGVPTLAISGCVTVPWAATEPGTTRPTAASEATRNRRT
jgi:hypothetical protein